MPTSTVDIAAFKRDGYVILDVLSPDELRAMRAAADAVMAQPHIASDKRFHYLTLVMPGHINAKLLDLIDHPVLTRAVETMLGGGPLVLDNAALLAAEPGVSYRQGWHRDVLQVPQEFITDEMFSPRWKHNNVQMNLALADEGAFWAVPGSHQRPDTADERRAFAGSKHLSPVEATMPGGQCIVLKAGQAVLYHNNLIHRGYCDFTTPRRMIHIGYHSSRRPPTWHFYNFDDRKFPAEHLTALPPKARRWIDGRLAQWSRFPDVKASYRSGFEN